MKKPAQSHEDLIVWQKAHQFVLDVYSLTKIFPKEEMFVLAPQLRRAAISIPSNIAEGFRKKSKQDKARFYNIAEGSMNECSYHLRLAHDLGYSDTSVLRRQLTEVSKLLRVYTSTILNSNS